MEKEIEEMKTIKVKKLIEILQACNPDANVFMTSGVEKITDIISVQSFSETVIIKCDENIFEHQVEYLTEE